MIIPVIASAGWRAWVDTLLQGHLVLIATLTRFAAPSVQFEVIVGWEPWDWLANNVDHRWLVNVVSYFIWKLPPIRALISLLGEVGVEVVLMKEEGSFNVFFDVISQRNVIVKAHVWWVHLFVVEKVLLGELPKVVCQCGFCFHVQFSVTSNANEFPYLKISCIVVEPDFGSLLW